MGQELFSKYCFCNINNFIGLLIYIRHAIVNYRDTTLIKIVVIVKRVAKSTVAQGHRSMTKVYVARVCSVHYRGAAGGA